jgi:hypothetical protein
MPKKPYDRVGVMYAIVTKANIKNENRKARALQSLMNKDARSMRARHAAMHRARSAEDKANKESAFYREIAQMEPAWEKEMVIEIAENILLEKIRIGTRALKPHVPYTGGEIVAKIIDGKSEFVHFLRSILYEKMTEDDALTLCENNPYKRHVLEIHASRLKETGYRFESEVVSVLFGPHSPYTMRDVSREEKLVTWSEWLEYLEEILPEEAAHIIPKVKFSFFECLTGDGRNACVDKDTPEEKANTLIK